MLLDEIVFIAKETKQEWIIKENFSFAGIDKKTYSKYTTLL